MLTTAKLSPSVVVLTNRLERFCWTCAKAAVMASSCRMAGSEIKPLYTSGTQAEEARQEKMPSTAATGTASES